MTDFPANTRSQALPAVRTARTSVVPTVIASLLAILADFLVLWLSFWLAYKLRYTWQVGGEVFAFNQREFSDFYGRTALFALFCLAIFLIRGVYRLSSWTTLLDEMGLVAGSVTMAMGGLLLTAYLSQFSPSRLLFVYTWAISLGFLLLVRIARRQIREALWARDIGVRRVLIVGNGTSGRRLMQMHIRQIGHGSCQARECQRIGFIGVNLCPGCRQNPGEAPDIGTKIYRDIPRPKPRHIGVKSGKGARCPGAAQLAPRRKPDAPWPALRRQQRPLVERSRFVSDAHASAPASVRRKASAHFLASARTRPI